MNRLLAFIKQSCGAGDDVSSKRIIMYIFTLVACLMVLIQGVAAFIIIRKLVIGLKIVIVNVFPDIIWYCVFGIIAGIAGINGFMKQK